jgi:hypothetical protein
MELNKTQLIAIEKITNLNLRMPKIKDCFEFGEWLSLYNSIERALSVKEIAEIQDTFCILEDEIMRFDQENN